MAMLLCSHDHCVISKVGLPVRASPGSAKGKD